MKKLTRITIVSDRFVTVQARSFLPEQTLCPQCLAGTRPILFVHFTYIRVAIFRVVDRCLKAVLFR